MPLTRSFGQLAQKRIARDPAFADALLCEGIDIMLAGDVDTRAEINPLAPRGQHFFGWGPPSVEPADNSPSLGVDERLK